MNLNQIINMILRQVMHRLVRSGVNAGINAASNLGKKSTRSAQPMGTDRYGLASDDSTQAEMGAQQGKSAEERARIREMRQARRAARGGKP